MDNGADRPGSPSRRTVVRGATWTVPIVSLAAAAPAYAASLCPGVTTSWGLTATPGLQPYHDGDLVWTVTGLDLPLGSTITLVFTNLRPDQADAIFLDGRSGNLSAPAEPSSGIEGGSPYWLFGDGGQVTMTFTVTADVPVGSTMLLTLGTAYFNTGAFSAVWTIDPASPARCANLSGCITLDATGPTYTQNCSAPAPRQLTARQLARAQRRR